MYLHALQSSRKLAGVVLLQLLTEECGSQRFLQTFPNCGTKLLLVLKAAATDELQRSTWGALRSLFVRISQMLELPWVRQEGAALAGKLAGALGPIIKRKHGKSQPTSIVFQILALLLSLMSTTSLLLQILNREVRATPLNDDAVSCDIELMTGSTADVEVVALEALAVTPAAVPMAFRSHLKQPGLFAGAALCGEHSSAALRAAASHCLSLLLHVTGKWLLCPAARCALRSRVRMVLGQELCLRKGNGLFDRRPGRAMERCRAGCASNRALAVGYSVSWTGGRCGC